MKKFLSQTKTAIVFLVVTAILLGLYAYMVFRPISYGMKYRNETVYEGVKFEGTLIFSIGGKVSTENTNFEEPLEFYYYYKDGYLFNLTAETEEEYEEEVKNINENFDEAVAIPFYASKINAFRQVAIGLDAYVTTYTCAGAIVIAIVGGVVELGLIAITTLSFILSKKAKSDK